MYNLIFMFCLLLISTLQISNNQLLWDATILGGKQSPFSHTHFFQKHEQFSAEVHHSMGYLCKNDAAPL